MFVTSQGSAYARFDRALGTGNLHIVRTAALELPRVDLGDALRIIYLMRDDEALYERAVMRWLGRFCLECEGATPEDVEAAAKALRLLVFSPDDGTRTLSELCSAYGLRFIVDR
jgi:hypothetical protein